jgi:hypothetical protein
MPASFQPLSALDPELLVEYLGREDFPADIVRWKYFNARFNRGRERGYAWVKDEKIGGFLGLIPFQVFINGRFADAVWTCDWSVQDQSAKGVGILLLRQAQNRYEFLTQLGGNEATQKIVSRLSSKTVNDAGIVFHLPLRIGSALRVVRRKQPNLPVDAIEIVNRIPIRWPRRLPSGAVHFEPGVSEKLGAFLEPERRGDFYARYDFEYLRWQITDSPHLVAETCFHADGSEPRAAALIWREKRPDFWRLAVWSRTGAEKELEVVLSNVIRRVFENGGYILSLVASRMDQSVIDLVKGKGFIAAPRRRPLHIISSKRDGEVVPEMWPLSYLDTDYAYRF